MRRGQGQPLGKQTSVGETQDIGVGDAERIEQGGKISSRGIRGVLAVGQAAGGTPAPAQVGQDQPVPACQAVQWLAQVAVISVRAAVDDEQSAICRALGLRHEQAYGRIRGHGDVAFRPHGQVSAR